MIDQRQLDLFQERLFDQLDPNGTSSMTCYFLANLPLISKIPISYTQCLLASRIYFNLKSRS